MEDRAAHPTVGSRADGYLFEFREDGVYLTVYPSGDEIPFEMSDLQQILQDYAVDGYDVAELAAAVRAATGKPVKIGSRYHIPGDSANGQEETEPQTAAILVEVSRDKMQARVAFDTSEGGALPSAEQVREALAEKEVVFGIDDAAIAAGIQSSVPFIAARGRAPVNGENARIVRYFDLSVKGKPALQGNGNRVDYKNMNLFVLAKKGNLLAERIPQTEGKEGMNVYGITVAARNGRPVPVPNGKNVHVEEENKIIADMDGQITDTGKKIGIDPHLVIDSDVGVGTGNIDFVGSIEIHGGVADGFSVKATGDIEIHGLVNGKVEGQNVYVEGGISGTDRGSVKAREDIRAAFVENAKVEAGRDVYISDVILHSDVQAGKHVFVEEGRGQITGGTIAAGEEVRAKKIGNTAFVVTRVSVGVNPRVERQYRQLCREYKENKTRLKQIVQMLNTLQKIDTSKLPPQRVAQIAQLTRSQFPLAGKLKRDEALIKSLETELANMKHGKVRVSDTMYPGTRLSINSVLENVQSEIQHSTVQVRDDDIDIGPY